MVPATLALAAEPPMQDQPVCPIANPGDGIDGATGTLLFFICPCYLGDFSQIIRHRVILLSFSRSCTFLIKFTPKNQKVQTCETKVSTLFKEKCSSPGWSESI
jgi:hypothetical protein